MTVNEHVKVGTRVLVRAALLLALAYVLYLIRDVVILVLVAVITAAGLVPAIARLQKFGLSRTASVKVTRPS